MKRLIRRVLSKGPEIVISMGALGFLMLAALIVFLGAVAMGEALLR